MRDSSRFKAYGYLPCLVIMDKQPVFHLYNLTVKILNKKINIYFNMIKFNYRII